MTDPSRYPLRSGQDGIPGSGSGWKRAQLWVDLPSNLTASSSSVYQRGTLSDYRARTMTSQETFKLRRRNWKIDKVLHQHNHPLNIFWACLPGSFKPI
ncbi:hypothetical protein HBH64_223070 [Parastagonospora nodorum]|nr:hypothetical protein HBI02_227470 [Parastagonospora nodorum]KAH4287521.1 hypothetical protein HBI01_229700 [Parastagonospora nodorum]KAH4320924.1 hypothetical protein HBI00_219610 [Parastagonospora nodorum]KAH4355225.1 hypothetical protein HBH94_240010 [Parastagonospora nodorum]KAH4441114.1 hypothetical protein HBH90_228870 [Parastagonospora nodorum]